MILKVGLTGGTASGKSTVAALLGELGCVVIDADTIVHEMYRPGQTAYRAVVSEFGDEILNADGTLNRARLAEIAFQSAERIARLNALIHPLVIAREAEWIAEIERSSAGKDRIVVVEATLLLESGGRERYDRVVVVMASRETQIERALRRGMSRQDAERRLQHQMPEQERLELADYVIWNDGTKQDLAAATRELHQKLLSDLKKKRESERVRE